MSRWTKKHYIIMATALSNIKANVELIEYMCKFFHNDNELFSELRFKDFIKGLK